MVGGHARRPCPWQLAPGSGRARRPRPRQLAPSRPQLCSAAAAALQRAKTPPWDLRGGEQGRRVLEEPNDRGKGCSCPAAVETREWGTIPRVSYAYVSVALCWVKVQNWPHMESVNCILVWVEMTFCIKTVARQPFWFRGLHERSKIWCRREGIFGLWLFLYSII